MQGLSFIIHQLQGKYIPKLLSSFLILLFNKNVFGIFVIILLQNQARTEAFFISICVFNRSAISLGIRDLPGVGGGACQNLVSSVFNNKCVYYAMSEKMHRH